MDKHLEKEREEEEEQEEIDTALAKYGTYIILLFISHSPFMTHYVCCGSV